MNDTPDIEGAAPGSHSDWTTVPRSDRTAAIRLPTPFFDRYKDPDRFDPGHDLIAAINVALLLGQPLLLTGAPGCGKTSVGFWLAWQLGLGEPLVQVVKSTTSGRSLLYDFDELARFRDAQPGRTPLPDREHLTFNALGLAIVMSAALGSESSAVSANLLRSNWSPNRVLKFGERHVVLIDELDKAPRDTPNDLLFEIERMEFDVPELRAHITGNAARRPIVVITSNTEKTLPEPFLRRCIFHHIKSPDAKRRLQIIAKRRHPFAARAPLFKEAMSFFELLQERLGRAPGTAELLAWLDVLEGMVFRAEAAAGAVRVTTLRGRIAESLGTLAKTEEDLRNINGALSSAGLE